MNSQDDRWDKVLRGELPVNHSSPLELKAHKIRHIALWKGAENERVLITSRQAYTFHRRVKAINQRRRKLKLLFIGTVSVISLAIALLAYKSSYDETHRVIKNTSSQNLITKGTINDMPYMLEIQSGQFTMGCVSGWDDKVVSCPSSEQEAHEVFIKKFAISKYETTIEQFTKFINETNYITTAEGKNDPGCTIKGKQSPWLHSAEHNWRNPGFTQSSDHPVVCISWLDAQAYIKWLSQKTGIHYRLPTEAEWEYAARARKATAYYWGDYADKNFANYKGTGDRDQWEYTSPAGQLPANEFGIYEILGNAWEWVEDCWRENYQSQCTDQSWKTRRGGSWIDLPRNIRASYRSRDPATARSYLYGFRVAHDLD